MSARGRKRRKNAKRKKRRRRSGRKNVRRKRNERRRESGSVKGRETENVTETETETETGTGGHAEATLIVATPVEHQTGNGADPVIAGGPGAETRRGRGNANAAGTAEYLEPHSTIIFLVTEICHHKRAEHCCLLL